MKHNVSQKIKTTLPELEAFIGLIAARGITDNRTNNVKDLWHKNWGCPIFNKTMPRDRFIQIIHMF